MEKEKKYKSWLPLASGILLIVIAIVIYALTVVDSVKKGQGLNTTYASTGMSYLFSISLFLVGIMYGISSLFFDKEGLFTKTFLLSVLAITVGVILVKNAEGLGNSIVQTIGIALIIAGAIVLGKAIMFIIRKEKVQSIIFAFAIAAVGIAIGILSIVPGTKEVMTLALFFAVATFVLVGGIYSIIRYVKKMEKE